MEIGGPLREDASNGATGVFVNGRELPAPELFSLKRLAGEEGRDIGEGRYTLDENGVLISEDGAILVDLADKAREMKDELGDRTYYRQTVSDPSGVGNDHSPHLMGRAFLAFVGS
jgi:hypothetical protein